MTGDGEVELEQADAKVASPSSHVANLDLVDAIRKRMSQRELQVADARSAGRNWPEIAAELGLEAEALRKMYTRALDRIAQELNIQELM